MFPAIAIYLNAIGVFDHDDFGALAAKNSCYIQGVSEKMSFYNEVGALLTNRHFFWDTFYIDNR